ncbi:MAG TPA: hypothetical protein VFO41_16200 [Alphaproteobacteria bacterium]|nr:hypothetical protein [Alphaproteobacteria bacterium]
MSTKQDEFKERFVAILTNVRHGLVKDREAMSIVGERASRIVAEGNATTWKTFKARISQDAYSSVLRQLELEGNHLHTQKKLKQAYAAQLLATSLVAATQKDKQVREGTKLLDDLIDTMLKEYRATRNFEPVFNRAIS